MRGRALLRGSHPALELAPVKSSIAGAVCGKTFRGIVIFQHRRGGDNFEDGTGRELGLNGAIKKRAQFIFVELLPFFFGNANREIVWIRRWAADHGENFAGARIERDDGARARAEGLLGNRLQIVVDGQLNLFAGDGILLGKVIDFFPDAVDDDAAHAVRAHQDVVVLTFESGFADAGFDLLFTDFTDVPAGMAHESAGHVAAAGDREHFQNGKIGSMRFDERDVRRRGFRFDDDRLKLRQRLGGVELIVKVVDRKAEAIRDRSKTLFDQSGIVAQEKDAKGWAIVDQDAAIAIEHAAARRDDGDGADAIAFGHLAVLIGVNNLQFPEAEQQHTDHAHNDVGGHCQPLLRQSIVAAK